MKYTSLKISKLLSENGCNLESEKMWVKFSLNKNPKLWFSDINSKIKITCLSGKREYEYPAYDILNDICANYHKRFFSGTDEEIFQHCGMILHDMMTGNIERAEDYIWSNTIFNPKNK